MFLVLVAGVPSREQMGGEDGDVDFPGAERRDGDAGAETLVKVLAEGAGQHHFPEVPVGGGDDTDVDLDRLVAADGLDFPLVEGAQQLRLGRQGEFADFIQEEDATVGGLEFPLVIAGSSCERPFLVAEQLAPRERSRM